jgi:hypothetical protein
MLVAAVGVVTGVDVVVWKVTGNSPPAEMYLGRGKGVLEYLTCP